MRSWTCLRCGMARTRWTFPSRMKMLVRGIFRGCWSSMGHWVFTTCSSCRGLWAKSHSNAIERFAVQLPHCHILTLYYMVSRQRWQVGLAPDVVWQGHAWPACCKNAATLWRPPTPREPSNMRLHSWWKCPTRSTLQAFVSNIQQASIWNKYVV